MGLLARKEVDNLVYEIYITHLYKDKWVNTRFYFDIKENLEQVQEWMINFNLRLKNNRFQELESHPYGTVCKVIIYNQNTCIPILEVQDKVICHPKDQFSRKEGRRLSYNKVKQQVNLEHIEILDTLIK